MTPGIIKLQVCLRLPVRFIQKLILRIAACKCFTHGHCKPRHINMRLPVVFFALHRAWCLFLHTNPILVNGHQYKGGWPRLDVDHQIPSAIQGERGNTPLPVLYNPPYKKPPAFSGGFKLLTVSYINAVMPVTTPWRRGWRQMRFPSTIKAPISPNWLTGDIKSRNCMNEGISISWYTPSVT